MKMAIEMFSIIIVVTISMILFSSVISSENQNAAAREFYNVVANRIEDSNCNSQVIEECKEEAQANGYDLQVIDVTIYEEEPSYYITVGYTVTFPVFQMFGAYEGKQAVIEGYAR